VIFLLSGRNPHIIKKGVYAEIDLDVRKYIGTKIFVSTMTGLLVWGSLAIFKLELAGVFGMLAFLLNFIPNIGSIIATLLPLPIAVAQFDNPVLIILVVAIPGAIQMTIGNGIEPKLMGKGLNLHPVTVLLALAFWGLLWGVAGMFLAVPMTAVIRIILMRFETFKPVGAILAGELPE
jgi:AI-2 transport protein TqsA